MKRGIIFLFLIILASSALAEEVCDLEVSLINQDPYPAVPGDYIKLVFQLKGVESPDCSDITFNLLSDYPIGFDPGESGLRQFKRVNYIKDFESNILIPYEVRIDEDALNGATPIEVRVQSRGDIPFSKTFNIEVSDVRADFEIYVKDYSYETHEMTLEILNIGESDIEALSLEIPKQDSIEIKGANRIIVGDLDSSEYTTADFEATPSDEDFFINLIYSDTISTRRSIQKTVSFDSSYFTGRRADQKTTSPISYIIWILILALIIWFVFRKIKKKKKKK